MGIESLYYALAVILILVGIAGVILPALPGLPLVFIGMLLAAWAGDFQQIGWVTLVVLGLLTLLSVAVDFFATLVGAKRVGASKKALWGAVLGTFVGIFFGPIGEDVRCYYAKAFRHMHRPSPTSDHTLAALVTLSID